jgi:predicted XRE-type DNA-binding protein
MTVRSSGEGENRVEYGSGDVFADLGLDLTADERMRIEVARQISQAIADAKLTQAEAARQIGVDQAKISAITRGRIDGFSLQRLVGFLLLLGWDVDIRFRPSSSKRGQVRIGSDAAAENRKSFA